MTGGTVHLSSNDVAAATVDYPFTAADAGVRVGQPFTLKTATQTAAIYVTDAARAAVTGSQSGIEVRGAGAATVVVAGYPSRSTAGVAGAVTLTAQDAFANVASDYRGTVHLSSNDPAAGLAADYVFTAADGGTSPPQAVVLKTATSHGTIVATDVAQPGLGGALDELIITPAATTQLLVTGYPSVSVSGTTAPITVTAQDPYNNTDINYRGTVHLSTNDSSTPALPDYTFGAADAGVSEPQPLMLETVTSSGAIYATDAADSSVSGAQAPLKVSPQRATYFVVHGYASPSPAGVAGSVTLVAKAPAGQTATDYRGTVHLSSNDAAASPGADYVFTAADAGVSPALSLTLQTATSLGKVVATDVVDSTLTGAQAAIVVTPAAASSLAGRAAA
ncbi:MAG: hypothetical protein EOO40_07880, partial [Deltaproteobacteria bacterium]